jgi:hypothetical protein
MHPIGRLLIKAYAACLGIALALAILIGLTSSAEGRGFAALPIMFAGMPWTSLFESNMPGWLSMPALIACIGMNFAVLWACGWVMRWIDDASKD